MTATPPAGGSTPGPDCQGPGPAWGAPEQQRWGATPQPEQGWGTLAQPGASGGPVQPSWQPPASGQQWQSPTGQQWQSPAGNQPGQSPATQQWQSATPAAQQPWQPAAGGNQSWGAPSAAAPAQPPAPPENVVRGVLFSLGSLVVGATLAILFSWGGFIASISAIAAAYAALWLYVKGAGAAPRKGAIPLLVVLLVGIAVQFLAVVGFGVWRVSRGRGASQWQYVLSSMFNPAVWEGYALEGVMIVVFSLLGIFGTIRGLVANRR